MSVFVFNEGGTGTSLSAPGWGVVAPLAFPRDKVKKAVLELEWWT